MTTFYDMMATPSCALVCLGVMAGMAVLLYAMASARSLRMPLRHMALSGAVFAFSFALMMLATGGMELVGYWHMPLRGVYELFCGLPFAFYVALLVVVAATCSVELIVIRRWRASHITPSSVKEAVDRLPQGLRFTDAAGRVVLENLAMGEADADPDGKTAWKRTERVIYVGGEAFTQETAADVTAWRELNEQLQARIAELREMQNVLVRFQRDVKDVVREQEMLEAKVAVHDELGHLLLMSERYLADPSGDVDLARLLALWDTTLGSLMGGMEGRAGGDAVSQAVDDARDMGVSVSFQGRAPEDAAHAELLARAVRECAANAAKHAGATELRVSVAESDDGSLVLEFTNNGRPPRREARETGGLASLRRSIEASGGAMRVEWRPTFKLRINVPG